MHAIKLTDLATSILCSSFSSYHTLILSCDILSAHNSASALASRFDNCMMKLLQTAQD